MLLVDLIEANPKTKFILFHGGFPWVGETGVILMRHGSHVWLDSVWLPTISYTTAKRRVPRMARGHALEPDHVGGRRQPRRRDLRGDRDDHAPCLAEVLAEKVDRGDLREEHAVGIGRQILRDNALALFPQLQGKLWKHKGMRLSPPDPAPPGRHAD